MTTSIRLALLASCALFFIASFAMRRVPGAHAAPGKDEANQRAFNLPGSRSASEQQQAGTQKSTPAQSSAPTVREIDVEGLKKLVAREGKEARPLLINFWATWCEPCRAEFPDLVKIEDEYRSRGLDFITVSLDEASEINTTVPAFLKEMRATMPAYLLNTLEPEAAIQFVDPQWSGSLPATFLFDAQGKAVFRHMGRIKPESLRAAINRVISDRK